MPFNPEEAAKKLGLQPKIQVNGSGGSFDPSRAAQSLGLQTLPDQGAVQNGASTADQLKEAGTFLQENASPVAKGLIPGGQNLSPALESVAGAVDQTVNGQNNFGDVSSPESPIRVRLTDAISNLPENFRRAKASSNEKLAKVEAEHPVGAALAELLSSVPFSVLTGNALKGAGLSSLSGQSGVIGGAYAGANSSSTSALGVGSDTAKGALFSMAFTKALQEAPTLISKGLEKFKKIPFESYLNYDSGVPTLDRLNVENVGVEVQPRSNGDFDIKLPGMMEKAKSAAKIGAEEGKLLSNPNLQAKISDEVSGIFGTDERPGAIPQIISKTKENLGKIRDGVLAERGTIPTDTESALKKAWSKVQNYDTGGDSEKVNAITDLKQRLQQIEFNLRSQSPSTNLGDVPLGTTFTEKQNLGEKLFGKQQLYKKASDVRSIVQDLWGDLGKSASLVDNQVKTLTDGFAALYRMENNAINSPAKLDQLASPVAKIARDSYKDFINPLMKLDPNVRASLMPELQEYVASEMPKILNKSAIVKSINNNSDSAGGIGWLLNKLYLSEPGVLKTAGALGALGNKALVPSGAPIPAMSPANFSNQGGNFGRALAPFVGTQSTGGALQEVK